MLGEDISSTPQGGCLFGWMATTCGRSTLMGVCPLEGNVK